jgi:hypothetical protein
VTARLPGPGPQLSSGRLRVDAGRAIKKLREYQLADRSAWILEAVRAAVAGRATTIRVDGDANDIWLSWEGPAWDVDLLPRLFDELVSPASSDDVQHVRLLAAAVNSALGMNPAYVDVFTVTAGKAHVARYTPDVLEEPTEDLEESRLGHVAATETAAPKGVTTGMAIHLRRRLSFEVLGYLVGDPPELHRVEESCRDIAVPLHIKGRVLHRETSNDILRVSLGEGVDGFVAVARGLLAGPMLQVAEHGVLLATYGLELDAPPEEGRTLPLRVFVDAPRMPTNASRSQVRRDKHPISSAETRAAKLIGDVIAKLAATPGDEARAATLEWVAAYIGGPRWHAGGNGEAKGPVRELLKLPLVKNAVGEPRSLNNLWRTEIHTGSKPLPSELTAWLSDMLWLPPDDAAHCLLQGAPIDGRAARRAVRWAKRQADSQRKFFAHAKRDARVETARKPRVRGKLGADIVGSTVDQARFDRLTGEICVYAEGQGGSLIVLLEGRELERISIKSGIAFDAVIDSPSVKPDERYRGVQRDAEYKRVERAVMGGLVRALEAVAVVRAGADVVDGYEVLAGTGQVDDADLFRRVLGMLDELGLKLRGPLTTAPAWESLDGKWVAPVDLRKDAIGVVEAGASVITPKGRLVVYATESERGMLGKLVGGRIIRYDRVAGERAWGQPKLLAERLAKGRPGALGIEIDGVVGAIAPSSKATIQLQHVGLPLETRPYKSKHLSCAILIDSDAIVPDTDWRNVLDDAGLFKRNYESWEVALIRALARALCGEWGPNLVGRQFGLRDPLGLAMCDALVDGDPEALLGPELLAALKRAPLLSLLGRTGAVSIDQVVELFPHDIPVLQMDAEPIPGFTPLWAPPLVAQLVGKLAGVKTHDATGELQQRIKRAQYEKRYAEHCAKPVAEVRIDTPEGVEVIGQQVRGFLGLAESLQGIRVFVEQRRFADLPAPDGLPLIAAVELAPDQCGELFEGIPASVAKKIAKDIRKAAPALLVQIGNHRPSVLTQPGAARRLLAAILDDLTEPQRYALCRVPAFRTITGELVTLETAAQPNRAIRYATWSEEWLAPGDGESASALDAPILRIVDDEELTKICHTLSDLPLVDETDSVERLQAHRRMARGLLPAPRVPGGLPELKRSLSELGDAGKRLGHGELALVDTDQSMVRLHDRGRFLRALPIEVQPAVVLAIEDRDIKAPDRSGKLEMFLEAHPLTRATQHLTRVLLEKILPGASLSPRMRNNLARAVLLKHIDAKLLGDLQVLETIDGRWLPWSAITQQVAIFDEIWAVAERTPNRPLDERRIVFVFPGYDMTRIQAQGFVVVPAAKELEMDEQARRNRARQHVISLALPTKHGVLVEAELRGDGITSPRGTVAILTPTITGNRGIWVHREMQPLGVANDPCPWPTVAVVDDARIVPDRTWSGPKPDQTWQAIAKTVREASETLLASLGEAPVDAITTLRIDQELASGSKELRKHGKSQLRGLVWLAGLPYDKRYRLQLTHNLGVMTHTPEHGEAVGGQLVLFASDNLDRTMLLNQIITIAHGELVRQILARRDQLPQVVSAHVAHALALETIKPTEVRGFEFACFAPHPLEARGLVSLFRKNRVDVVKPGESPTVTALVDDGSPTSQTLLNYLGKRARRVEPAPQIVIPLPAAPKPAPKPEPTPAPKPAPVVVAKAPGPPPPVRRHALQDLVDALDERLIALGIRGYEWKIVDDDKPMIGFSSGKITVAGNHPRLRKLAIDLDEDAIELVVAHVVTVLNIALTSITDATEVHALSVLLASRPSEDPPQSPRSS